MNQRLVPLAILTTVLCLLPGFCVADDWPQWRGPDRDAKSDETGLLQQGREGGPPLAWSVEGMGIGYSSVSVADGKIFTLGDLDDGSYITVGQTRSATSCRRV